MIVTLTTTSSARDEGTIIVFTGTGEAGETVVFAVDHRPAGALIDAVLFEGSLDVEVEPWQILAVR